MPGVSIWAGRSTKFDGGDVLAGGLPQDFGAFTCQCEGFGGPEMTLRDEAPSSIFNLSSGSSSAWFGDFFGVLINEFCRPKKRFATVSVHALQGTAAHHRRPNGCRESMGPSQWHSSPVCHLDS